MHCPLLFVLFGKNGSSHLTTQRFFSNELNEYLLMIWLQFYPVKLSMEVSFTTHSHIIGRAGTNINTVMKETSTKIHFPDENRVAGEKKSNEVTISGELVNVETARRRIRVCMLIYFNFL